MDGSAEPIGGCARGEAAGDRADGPQAYLTR